MPAIALEGLELLIVALAFVLLAMAESMRYWIQPWADLAGKVPVIGGHLKGWTNGVANAIVSGLRGFLHVNLRVLHTLFHWSAWSIHELASAGAELAGQTESALHHLRHSALPALVHAATAELHKALATFRADLHRLEHAATHGLGAIAHDLRALEHELRVEVERPFKALLKHTIPGLKAADAALEGELHDVVLPGLKEAEAIAKGALGDLKALEAKLNAAGLWGLAGGLAGLAGVVALIEAEAGLGDPACRSKVKGICSTDPLAWANLLLGLSAIGAGFSIEQLIELGAKGVGRAEPYISELVKR